MCERSIQVSSAQTSINKQWKATPVIFRIIFPWIVDIEYRHDPSWTAESWQNVYFRLPIARNNGLFSPNYTMPIIKLLLKSAFRSRELILQEKDRMVQIALGSHPIAAVLLTNWNQFPISWLYKTIRLLFDRIKVKIYTRPLLPHSM